MLWLCQGQVRWKGCSWARCSQDQGDVLEFCAGARTESGNSWRDRICEFISTSILFITERERAELLGVGKEGSVRREGGSSSNSLWGVGCTEAGAAAVLSPGRQGPLAEHPCPALGCWGGRSWGNLEHLFSCSILWLPGPSSDMDVSAFGCLCLCFTQWWTSNRPCCTRGFPQGVCFWNKALPPGM